jgi:hypothetical protein
MVNATLDATAPTVTGLNPNSGPTTGGQVVVISADHAANVSEVHFGALPATSFTQTSPSQLTAVTPAQAAGTVDVTITNAAGTSQASASTKYTYIGPDSSEPPDTTITKQPKKKTSKHKAKFSFESTTPGSSFECKLDKGGFKPCNSPFKHKVDDGKHKFQVRAIDPDGRIDTTPAKYSWKVT